jgi:formate-dependent nitrite reductase membrane component NrfD
MPDGRFIDTAIGGLEGEAAGQIAPEFAVAAAPHRPFLKAPVWIWSIPAYFFVGGVGGAAMAMGLAAQLFGGPGLRRFDRRCRWTGAVAGGVGSALLIWDLGRKSRFLFMLRVFRPTSPMSVGSWVLAAATPLSGASAILPGPAGWLAGLGAGLLGLPLATYTGVLLGNTAVPVWSASRRALPLLFGASAVASLASIFELMDLDPRERRIMFRFGTAGRVAELAATAFLDEEVRRAPRVSEPLRDGLSGALWNAAAVCTVASLAVSLLPGGRPKRWAGGALGVAGGLCLRFALFYAGKRSARSGALQTPQTEREHEQHDRRGQV